jgi:hypothetical protein
VNVLVPSARSEEISIGKAAFLAPLIFTFPAKGRPPSTMILSMSLPQYYQYPKPVFSNISAFQSVQPMNSEPLNL